MSKTILLKAGQRQRIFRLFSSSIPSTINFNAAPTSGDDVSGVVEVARWHWFNWKNEKHPLQKSNAVEKGFGDADFIIHVTADQDCTISFASKDFGFPMILFILATIAFVGVAAALILLTGAN